jgi:hypothetical protein
MIVTQIVMPVLQNRPLFPMLRKSEADLVEELEKVNQELREQELKEEVRRKKQLIKNEVPEVKNESNEEIK